jgi:hypothetical protein
MRVGLQPDGKIGEKEEKAKENYNYKENMEETSKGKQTANVK